MTDVTDVTETGRSGVTDRRPVLLFYCQHSLGIGHLVRSFSLCAALSERFRVVLLSGGTLPEGIDLPHDVELVALPALHATPSFALAADDGRSVDETFADRTRILVERVERDRPAAVVVEFFPFGRKKFAVELVPFLTAARAAGAVVACSLRDILVSRDDGGRHDERASVTANQLLDAVLVHADPRLARLDETFHPATPLAVPVHYTGYVVPERGPGDGSPRARRVVVSVGGGTVGEPLLLAALDAQPALHEAGYDVRLITGPLCPDSTWNLVHELGAGRPGLEIIRVVPDLVAELRQAAASVSQCGYNTSLDLVRSGVPAVVAPLIEDGDEEPRRACRLRELGLVRVVDREHLDGRHLAGAVLAAIADGPAGVELDLDGARTTAALVAEMVDAAEPVRA